MAAHQLLKRGAKVTMLESGIEFPKGRLIRILGKNLFRRFPEMRCNDRHVPTGAPETKWYYTMAPGGLSNNWTGAVPRFTPDDFTEGERLGPQWRWPVTYPDMVPWYETVEPLLTITAGTDEVPMLPKGLAAYRRALPLDWQPLAEAARRHGQGFSTIPICEGPPTLIVNRAAAFNSFTEIVQPLLRNADFTLQTGMHALKLEWNSAKGCVSGIVCRNRATGNDERIECDAVVLAAGPLNSTKILFDSACSDHPQGLGNNHGVLGLYLHDHPKEWWVLDLDRPTSLLAPAGYVTRKPFETSEPLMANSWTMGVADDKDKIRSRFGLKGDRVAVQVFGTMVPTTDYYVRPCASTKDEFGTPKLDIHIQFDKPVIDNMVQARGHLRFLMEEAGMKPVPQPVEPQLYPGVAVHYGGTARMHSDPQFGVVDAWNRVFDARNVLVVDAACFTTGSEKNPTLTAMALAARASDRLIDDLKSGAA
jgi:choline dehydrogenase-like flavoprotein